MSRKSKKRSRKSSSSKEETIQRNDGTSAIVEETAKEEDEESPAKRASVSTNVNHDDDDDDDDVATGMDTNDGTTRKPKTDSTKDDTDDEDDDEDLQAMAAAWADSHVTESNKSVKDKSMPHIVGSTSSNDEKNNAKPSSKKQKQIEDKKNNTTSRKDFSLHITQLHFDTTEWELRQFFVQYAGCSFSQVRMVYDQGVDGKPVFRGVAFGECSNEAQYKAALQLHQSPHRLHGRRINVRPVRTKAELADLVAQRNELVQAKLESLLQKRQKKNESDEEDNKDQDKSFSNTKSKRSKGVSLAHKDNTAKFRHKSSASKADGKRKEASQGTQNKKLSGKPVPKKGHKEKAKHEKPTGNKKGTTDGKTTEKHKLTKKERNRRAAIIMARKRAANHV